MLFPKNYNIENIELIGTYNIGKQVKYLKGITTYKYELLMKRQVKMNKSGIP